MPTSLLDREDVTGKLLRNYPIYAEECLWIVPKKGKRIRFALRPSQLLLDRKLEEQRANGQPQRAIILKCRQEGFSTASEGKLLQRATLLENHNALVVAHDRETGGSLYLIVERMYSNLPDDPDFLKPDIRSHGRSRFMHFGDKGSDAWQAGAIYPDSTYSVGTAGEFEAGRGATFHSLHLCLAPDTPILLENGEVRAVKDATVGSKVLTHTGAEARITAISASAPTERNGNGRSVIITPWLGQPIELTPNHPVWVRSRRSDAKRLGYWKRADQVTLRDQVAMPVRPITHELLTVTLPEVKYRHNSYMGAIGSGELVELTEEFGFAMGYYLAEGSLTRNHGKASGIVFARHRQEVAYADRAIAGLGQIISGRNTRDREASLTTVEEVHGSPLARFIEAEFGAKQSKRVPDWVFRAGSDFCRGLLAGYLSGDGSKTDGQQGAYRLSTLTATSICSSIAFQMRDLVASLGYGWGAVDPKPAGVRHGRDCQAAWTVRWTGRAARSLRGLIGLDAADNGRARTEKADLSDGFAWSKLRKIEEGTLSEVYDVEVDHRDHSFRTAAFAVKNSEVAFWPQIEQKLTALLQAVPDDPDSLVIVESTANGFNEFKDLWDAADAGSNQFVPIFWPWWKTPEYTRPFANEAEREAFDPGTGPWGEDEPALLEGMRDYETGELVPLTLEQLNWRRWAIENKLNGKLDKFKQEYPSYPEEAFLSTGNKVFDGNLVRGVLKEVEATDPRLPDPEIGPEEGLLAPKGYQTRAGLSGPISVPTEPIWTPRFKMPMFEEALWRIWDEPDEDRTYVLGADVSGGIAESDDDSPGAEPAYHAIQVIDHLTKKQVCEYRSRVDPDLFTTHVYLTALYYNHAWAAPEATGGYGAAVARKLGQDFRYNRTYRRKTVDRSNDHALDKFGWDTTRASKSILIAGGQELLREGSHGIRSRRLALELLTYVRDPKTGKEKPEPGKFSDLLMAWLIAQQVAMLVPPVPFKKKGSSRTGKGYQPRDRVSGY